MSFTAFSRTVLAVALLLCPVVLVSQTIYPLTAGQHMAAGTVTVSGCPGPFTVTFATNPGASLLETHLHVAAAPADIPQKNGNPIPGQFAYKAVHQPPVQTFTYTPSCAGPPVYIAAHAVVAGSFAGATVQVLSGQPAGIVTQGSPVPVAGTTVTLKRIGGAGQGPNLVQNAVQAEVVNERWIDHLDGKDGRDALLAAGARWVWDLPRVGCLSPDPQSCLYGSTNPETLNGSVVRLVHEFSVPKGTWTGGQLEITCDNGYVAALNGRMLGFSQVNPASMWNASDYLMEGTVPTYGWQWVKTHVIPAGLLLPGQVNTLLIDAANERMIAGDPVTSGPPQANGTVQSNPGGCLYRLSATALGGSGSETAWGGTATFLGKNWATYIVYPPPPPPPPL